MEPALDEGDRLLHRARFRTARPALGTRHGRLHGATGRSPRRPATVRSPRGSIRGHPCRAGSRGPGREFLAHPRKAVLRAVPRSAMRLAGRGVSAPLRRDRHRAPVRPVPFGRPPGRAGSPRASLPRRVARRGGGVVPPIGGLPDVQRAGRRHRGRGRRGGGRPSRFGAGNRRRHRRHHGPPSSAVAGKPGGVSVHGHFSAPSRPGRSASSARTVVSAPGPSTSKRIPASRDSRGRRSTSWCARTCSMPRGTWRRPSGMSGRCLPRGGLLALVEVVRPIGWVDATFGLTEGWWRFEDASIRPSYPLLTADGWVSLLGKTGFTGASTLPASGSEAERAFGEVVVIARAPAEDADSATGGIGEGKIRRCAMAGPVGSGRGRRSPRGPSARIGR